MVANKCAEVLHEREGELTYMQQHRAMEHAERAVTEPSCPGSSLGRVNWQCVVRYGARLYLGCL